MLTALIAVFIVAPILLIVVGYLVTRSALWAGMALIIVTAFSGYGNTLFWYALIFGSVLGMVFPKQREPRWS